MFHRQRINLAAASLADLMVGSVAGMGEFHESTGSYPLDALEAAERAEFEAHLATCEPCRDEVGQVRETAAELSVLSGATPPPRMCGNVLDATRTTPRNPARTKVSTQPP